MVGYDSPFGKRLSRHDFVVRGGAGLMGLCSSGPRDVAEMAHHKSARTFKAPRPS